jgi:hypothetical protein
MSVQPATVKDEWVEPPDDPEENARVARNLDMAQVFIAKLFENPALLEEIPYGAHLVFLPDDPAVAAENRAFGKAMQEQGILVHFVDVP